MDSITTSFVLYGLLPLTTIGMIYFWKIQQKHNRIVFEFDIYRSELYQTQNAIQYFVIYRKIMKWSNRLSTSQTHQLLRVELFELVKKRKDALGIKKNIKMIN